MKARSIKRKSTEEIKIALHKSIHENFYPTLAICFISKSHKQLLASKLFLDKIFQPFFTTKPTGKGTGLGLSLSYDIIKAYEGELKVETQEGIGTAFKILIPVNK